MNPLFDLMYVQGQHQSSELHNSDMNKMARNKQIGNSTDNILSPYIAEQNRTIKSEPLYDEDGSIKPVDLLCTGEKGRDDFIYFDLKEEGSKASCYDRDN